MFPSPGKGGVKVFEIGRNSVQSRCQASVRAERGHR